MRRLNSIAASLPFKVPSLFDRLRDYRNWLVANPKVQQLAAANPLTRPIARQKARQLFDICAGFVYFQILNSCLRLGVFDALKAQSLTLIQLGQAIDLPEDATKRLVDAGSSLKLLAWRGDGKVALGELGAALNANPAVKSMIHHHADLYDDLRDPVALLRGDVREARLSSYWAYVNVDEPANLSDVEVAQYSDLMSASQQLVADEVLASYPVKKHHKLLDVGGGDGTFAIAAARAVPHLQVMSFDLPAVAKRAEAHFKEVGLANRAAAIGGDFVADSLPAGADLITLVRVLYDHNDEKALTILKAVRQALPASGKLLIAEPMSDAPGAGRVGDAYFGFYLLAMGSGRPRRPAEFNDMLRASGFSSNRVIPTRMPLQTGLIVAQA